ncbi:MAG: RNA polymerase Rpb4 family protein [Candidatus Bilamarchaeaceae archaeon]
MDILESQPISVAEVKKILEERKKEGELNYEQAMALEHADKISKLTPKKAQELVDALLEKNKKLLRETAIKIIDVQPKKASTLKAILLKDKIELNDDEINEILKLLG